jgi:hypothetical protein
LRYSGGIIVERKRLVNKSPCPVNLLLTGDNRLLDRDMLAGLRQHTVTSLILTPED